MWMPSNSGMTCHRGFTLLELLAVVGIVGILATIAVARLGDSKRRAYLSAMKSDLHSVATMAESQFIAEGSYEHLIVSSSSAGVTLTFSGSATGWTAVATQTGLQGIACTMESGPGTSMEIDCR